tara:strand:- start:21794 stop:24331 length:2538 start_codon:yes stop_codon:yes gene_type:complete
MIFNFLIKMKFFFITILFSISFYGQNENTNLNYYFSELNFESLDPSIPTPEEIIGHKVGEWHVTHDKLVQYMYELADLSERITIEDRGKTFENRPLILLTITSKKNHSNIDKIIEDHKKLTDSNKNITIEDKPIIVYQGFSIHGNEASGSNASLLLAYYLAASNSKFINEILDETVILLDPSMNPDGLQRFAYWANSNKNMNLTSDSNDREYNEIWPGGRTNHYWFDLNRDWLPAQLPESQARIKSFNKWMPNILTDHHEMGTNSTFFFQPGIPSRTHPLTPKMNQQLTKEIAKFHVESLDEIGSLYYSEENFDDFYYGKGSTFPDINGSIGILFEQASSRGHVQESENGKLNFSFTIKNQLTTAISTLRAANFLREDILEYQKLFYRNSAKQANKFKNESIIFGTTKDTYRVKKLAQILNLHEVIMYDVDERFIHNGKHYEPGSSYIIPKNQKKYRLINAMFETRTKFNDSLFYDVSSWTLPLAFNLDYDLNFNNKKFKNEIKKISFNNEKKVELSNYAYLMEWHEYLSPKALNKLLEKDLVIKVATKKFSLEGKNYDYGTVLIPVLNNDPLVLNKFVNEIANESQLIINPVKTGYTKGPDLGSDNFKRIYKKNIALLVGDGVNAYDAGEIWHLLDTRYEIILSKIDTRNLNKVDLSKYTTLICPNSSINDSIIVKKIEKWVNEGGVLIGYKGSINWLKESNLIDVNVIKKETINAKDVSFEQKKNFFGAQRIGGAIFKTLLDRSHPINFGQSGDTMPIFRNSTIFLEKDPDSFNNPILYLEQPLLSGYVSEINLRMLKSTSPIKIQDVGKGKVVYLTDNTNFRAFWYGTNKILMNSIFFGKIM